MHKDVSGLVDTLYESVAGIVAAGAPDTTELLNKSFGEFAEALDEGLVQVYGPGPALLAKGLNHVSAFATALGKMQDTVDAIKVGYPVLSGEEDQPPEPVVASTQEALDRFVGHGVILLKQMVNDTAEMPESEEELTRAEQAGELVKVESAYGGEVLVKSDLPTELIGFLSDPLDLMVEMADVGSTMVDDARGIAEELLKADPEAIPHDVIEAFPLLFGVDEELGKAFPPRRGPPQEEEEVDPDDAEGSGAPDDDVASDITDDSPQNPIETITRLASIIVVIAGSLQQAMGGGDFDNAMQGASGAGMGGEDPRNVGLQREEPLLDQPLSKLLAEEADIRVPGLERMTLAEAIEELGELRKALPDMQRAVVEKSDAFKLLKTRYDELAAQPARMAGVARAVPVAKGQDINPDAITIEGDAERLEKLRGVDEEGGAAAKFLIKRMHQGGGTPLVPPAGMGG